MSAATTEHPWITPPDIARAAKYAHLAREDLEAAVDFWQPKAQEMRAENVTLKADKIVYERLKFWGRVKWLFRRTKRRR